VANFISEEIDGVVWFRPAGSPAAPPRPSPPKPAPPKPPSPRPAPKRSAQAEVKAIWREAAAEGAWHAARAREWPRGG
jgi:hypothetical protein